MSRPRLNKQAVQSSRNARLIRNMVACVCVCLAFAAGFLIRGNADILNRVGFVEEGSTQTENPGQTVTGSTYNSISARTAEMEGILNTESIDSYDLDTTTTNVLGAFVTSTEDPYLRYYDSARYANYIKDVSGQYAGIGVLFSEYEGKSYAVDVFEGSEAASKDVKVGDFIVAIDGDRGSEDGWSLVETVKALTRYEDESVVITWRRPASLESEGGTEFTTTLKCAQYTESNVTTEIINDRVGYIKLSQLTQNSADLVKNAITGLQGSGAQTLVLDLRDNPGGYLTQTVDIASLFIKSGVVVQIQAKTSTASKTATGSSITDLPLVVLTNGNTGAAAEVLAAALQDNNRATLVGTTTLGKGTVQSIRELSFGGALRYTSAQYLSPLGHTINHAGVAPSVIVDRNDDPQADNQKDLAVETAQALITE